MNAELSELIAAIKEFRSENPYPPNDVFKVMAEDKRRSERLDAALANAEKLK